MSANKVNFYNFTLKQLEEYLVVRGYEKYRAKQLFRWVYGLKMTDFSAMTNMSKVVRQEFAEIFDLSLPKMVSHLKSTDGTQKFLFDVGGGETIESVLIPSEDRMTLCVSSEIGCNMACKFCFTGKQKMKRRLTVTEIMGQYLGAMAALANDEISRRADEQSRRTDEQSIGAVEQPALAEAQMAEGQVTQNEMRDTRGTNDFAPRISNIVFMGMGEPLDNPEAVFASIENLHDPNGCNISLKKITVSTSGIVPLMPLITQSGARLAVSLNGVNDQVRTEIMPINKKWPLAELLAACKAYCDETGDRVTFEYVLLKGVTDSIQDARDLYKLTKNIPCKINIIPFNEHPGSGFTRPDEKQIVAFQNELIGLGAHVLRRKTMGRDIYAACGQLRSAYKGHPEKLQIQAIQR